MWTETIQGKHSEGDPFSEWGFQDTIDELTDKMMTASEEMRFEDAAGYRDLIQSIRKIGRGDRRLLPTEKKTEIL